MKKFCWDAWCAKTVLLNKIIQEPFVVTLNRKTKNKKFAPPCPVFAKTLKTEVDLKTGIFSDNLFPTLTKCRETHEWDLTTIFFFVSWKHSNVNYEIKKKKNPFPCLSEKLTSWRRLNRLSKTHFWSSPKIESTQTHEPYPWATPIPKHHPH